MVEFKEFMAEQRVVNRWFIMRIAMIGAFAGATLAVVFMIGVSVF